MLSLLAGMFSISKRMKQKGISGNLTGEGIKQGGVVLFDKNGQPRYAYREKTGTEIPLEDILAAVHAVKEEK